MKTTCAHSLNNGAVILYNVHIMQLTCGSCSASTISGANYHAKLYTSVKIMSC